MPAKDKRDALAIVAEFVLKAEKCKNDVLVGIDPGQTGAIAFWCWKHYCVVDIPVTVTKVRKTKKNNYKQRKATGKKTRIANCEVREFDLTAICELFKLLKPVKPRVHVILEKIPVTIGKRGRKYAEIILNRAYAMWPLFLHSKGYKVSQEKPGVWKEAFGLLGKEKEDDRHKALSFFPTADILRVKDHDRADALLLVEYLRRRLAGKKEKP